ncbi:MAG: M28 family peptidase [Solirubrobacterales bacterium]
MRARGKHAALVATVALVVFTTAACGGGDGASASPSADHFDAERAFEDVRAQVDLGPRPAGSEANAKQARLLARRLREAGVDDVRIQRSHLNVVGTIPGLERGAVVVGAHHDTVDIPGFVGANDGGSGVAVVLELARSLPSRLDGPDLRIALFDAEEARPGRDFSVDGAHGSRQYVRYAERKRRRQGSPPIKSVRAMVLFDLVGDCDLQIPRESNSDAGLYAAFAAASEDADGAAAPFAGSTAPVSDDHLPFLEQGIPAVDLIDFSFGGASSPGTYWHTTEDTLDKVCAGSLDAVGEAAVRAVPGLG